MSIQVKQLTKVYGQQKAVDGISFEVNKGDILGFLGPNGAGKSTTMKIATGYLPPSEGKVIVKGFDIVKESKKARAIIGYLPEHNPLYLDMFVHEYLAFIASLHQIKGKKRKQRIAEMIRLCGLTREQNKKISSLSKGYRQRVGLAQALLHDPEVLILDEPTTGLDPNQLAEIRGLIKQISKDKTVILSTHIMQEVKALCNRVVIINQGKIVANDSVAHLISGVKQVLHVELSKPVDLKAISEIKDFQFKDLGAGKYQVTSKLNKDIRERFFKLASERNWVILEMQLIEQDLEQIFYDLTNQQSNVGDL
ncbi:gliding motility protein GldA [Roseivirga seohaensis subsp. aquiponti]|uniref:Gliding motility protein GldA n=1 Tax=Roseivirga seohaensis subsp. aquiponti TaxID=1566026 RepID=A0A0L8AH07_9BACT|nr:gliding motility-associated ABC transporter ATP-binding subunit GldA [Roseivirga seohaensis]KOF01678.1 gliding motility protein GldA [Roseivirga seohaensis subsp. aquiponti]